MTHLYLIRHGESTIQVGDFLHDKGLTSLGVKQAEQLRTRLAGSGEIAADVLIASTYPRARQTAEIIAPALGLPIIFDDDVQEQRLGEAMDMSMEAFEAKYPNFRDERSPFVPFSAGGEGWGQFVLRVGTSLDRITREHAGKRIVVVCHGGVIDSSFIYFMGMNSLTLPPIRFRTINTSITHWKHDIPQNRAPLWRLMKYNDDMHLRNLNAETPISWESLSWPHRPESPATPQPEK